MTTILGGAGAKLVGAMVLISTLGTTIAIALAYPRIFYAMAEAGLLFAPLRRVHPRFQTPHVAVLAHGAIALIVVGWNSFERLAAVFVLGTWPFLALAAVGVILLRRSRPDLPRPYLTPGYPVVPLLFVAGTTWVVMSSLVEDPATTLASAGLTLAGVPIYLVRRHRARATSR